MHKRSFIVLICSMLFVFCLILPRVGNAAAPVVSSIDPNSCANTVPTTITITGWLFTDTHGISVWRGALYNRRL